LIEQRAKSGVFLSVLGFGVGNLKDATMKRLANRGNGNYAYVDTLNEAHKMLVSQMTGTLVTVAKDVKAQVEFNPAVVRSYRLLGYENRLLSAEDFNDDSVDAGEVGAGQSVTVLYEIEPAQGGGAGRPGVDPLKYQPNLEPRRPRAAGAELLTLKIRYQEPAGSVSQVLEISLRDTDRAFAEASADFKFAAAVASFGLILRDSPHRGQATLGAVLELANAGLAADAGGYRAEFVELVRRAQRASQSLRR
jgi:Ca-activated chloride channel family protein